MIIITWILQIILIPLTAPMFIGIIRKIKARFQNRIGASIFQPYIDLWKLLNKDEVISKDASWIFYYAPFIIFAVTILVGASIPLIATYLGNIVTADTLLVIYALSIGTFFLALAGMDTGSAFGGFGSSREMTLSSLAEGGFIFSLLTVALVTGSTNLFTMSNAIASLPGTAIISIVLAFAGFVVVMLAETARFPFDNPATHLELTMVHEAMILEYSGKRLALMEWASANKFLIFAALGANLFFPYGIAQTADFGALLIGILAFLLKMFAFSLAVALVESTIAKLRFFRLPELLFVSFILNILAIGLIR